MSWYHDTIHRMKWREKGRERGWSAYYNYVDHRVACQRHRRQAEASRNVRKSRAKRHQARAERVRGGGQAPPVRADVTYVPLLEFSPISEPGFRCPDKSHL
jgi:hypothetical protein